MTSLLSPLAAAGAGAAPEGPVRPASRRDIASAVALAIALLVWAGPVTSGAGGRDAWVLGLGLLSVLPALVVLRPWRHVPAWQVLVCLSPALAALVVCLTTPTAFDGLDEMASFAYAGGLYLVVRSWAVDSLRRRLLLVGVALVGLLQFTQAWLPWWGSGSVATQMTGTFYWHNQFSAFMLGTGLVAGVLAVRGTGPLRRAGWLTAPWCFSGLLFAGSRAGLATFVVVWVVVVVLSFLDRKGRVASLLLLAVALGLASLLSSSLLMDDSGGFDSTMKAREAEETVAGNGATRLVLWRGAVDLGLDHPVTGAGFDTFGTAGSALMPASTSLSAFAHNGYLQAFADGGVVLLAAVVAATGLPLLVGLRLLYRRRREDDVLAVAVPLATVALVLHSGVDFDWAYPSLLALFAVLAGLLPGAVRGPGIGDRRGTFALAALVLVVVSAALPGSLRASGLRAPGAEIPAWAEPIAAVVPVHGPLDLLPAGQVCRAQLLSDSRSVRERALVCSAEAAESDPSLELWRAEAEVRNGREQAGLRRADRVLARLATRRPMLRLLHAEVLEAAGRPDAARAEIVALHEELVRRHLVDDALVVQRILEGSPP
jgi:O-antigen ligase